MRIHSPSARPATVPRIAARRLLPMPDYNLSLDLVRTTEAAALAAARWVGRGEKNAADQAAVDAMRLFFNTVHMDGLVVIGEGEKDQAPMLFNGERIGTGDPPEVDVAVDPIDGTRLVAQGEANALSVVAVAERGSMFNPGPCVYMEKIATGREAASAIDITLSIETNIKNIARAKRMLVSEVTMMILDRPRHEEFIERVREDGSAGALCSPTATSPEPSPRPGRAQELTCFTALAERPKASSPPRLSNARGGNPGSAPPAER